MHELPPAELVIIEQSRYEILREQVVDIQVRVSLLLVTLAVGGTSLIGCGDSRIPTYPVSGQVVLQDGSTLPRGGKVIFFSRNQEPPIRAEGYFGADGKFELTTYEQGDGAPEGEYDAAVVPTVPDDQGGLSTREYLMAMEPIDDRYKVPGNSGLRFTVSAEDAPHEFRIEVTRPRRRR